MIGTTQMTISKEQMIAIVEHYLNDQLFVSALNTRHKVKVVDQIRKAGDRFVITFEGEQKAERPKTLNGSDLSRSTTEAIDGAPLLLSKQTIADAPLQEN